jgi:hypothetical protein
MIGRPIDSMFATPFALTLALFLKGEGITPASLHLFLCLSREKLSKVIACDEATCRAGDKK